MSWRDTYTGKGKFRNAEFLVKSSDMDFGRRKVVHEYPLRDDPNVEDLGLKADQFTIDAFVIGPDYHIARDAFIAAIKESGPGTLVHPYLGTMRVDVLNARKRESNAQGGRCQFTLTLITSGTNKYPDNRIDTQAAVKVQADKSIAESISDFASNFDVLTIAADQTKEVESELDDIIGSIDDVVGTVSGSLASLIRTPFNLGSALVGSVSKISSTIQEPKRALNLYTTLFSTGDDSPAVPKTTATRKQQAKSTDALHDVVKRAALIEACRSSSQANYATYDDAIDIRNILLSELDIQMQTDGMSDAVYLSLLDLRVLVVNDIRTRGADLSRLKNYTLLITLPSLVVSHKLYGDAARESEVVARNNISHPGFVPGGDVLEVLNV